MYFIYKIHLNVVADQVALANAFANIKPAQHFNGDQSVQPSISDRCLLPCSRGHTTDNLADSFIERGRK